tara:strand:- start:464 stop:712 length:249 start_codon:yes stop_codon:yes gene_type:complete
MEALIITYLLLIILILIVLAYQRKGKLLEENIKELVDELNKVSLEYKILSDKVHTTDVINDLNKTLNRFNDLEKRIKELLNK